MILALVKLEERKLHPQVFRGILPKFVKQQAQIARDSGHIVVKQGIFEEFAGSAVLGVQIGRGIAQILPRLAPSSKKRMPSGFALRFARIARLREDKAPSQATTLEELRQLYERQFDTKGQAQALSRPEPRRRGGGSMKL